MMAIMMMMMTLHHDASVEEVLFLRRNINFPPLKKNLRLSNTAAVSYFLISLFTALVCFQWLKCKLF